MNCSACAGLALASITAALPLIYGHLLPRHDEYTFRDLSPEDEADFLHALKPAADGAIEGVLGIGHGAMDKSERLRARKWCGDHKDVSMTA